ncbi:MAG: hypothetical protein NUV74_00220 [Candidatus Brocadiaceae bacterium]|nr:hypothetical protein [Candidatus Brocadiaceae bacterium]
MLKSYLKETYEITIRGDAREESYYSALEALLQRYAASAGNKETHITLQNMVNRNTGRKLKVNDAKRLSEEKISKLLADEHHIMAVQSDKAVIDFFNEQIERIEIEKDIQWEEERRGQ